MLFAFMTIATYAADAPLRQIDEVSDIKGVITSIAKGKMTIKSDDGQTYMLPVTKGVTGRDPKVGARIRLTIHCTLPPFKCSITVSI